MHHTTEPPPPPPHCRKIKKERNKKETKIKGYRLMGLFIRFVISPSELAQPPRLPGHYMMLAMLILSELRGAAEPGVGLPVVEVGLTGLLLGILAHCGCCSILIGGRVCVCGA